MNGRTLSYLAGLALVVSSLNACEGTTRDDTVQPVETDMLRASYGLGSDWYDYDSQTHILTPRSASWQYTRGEDFWDVAALSYYHAESGASGYFSLSISRNGGAAVELRTEQSVKEGLVCVDLDTASAVECDGATEHELVLRTDARPLPAAGFAVVNPALYFVRGEGRSVLESSDGQSVPLVSARDSTAGDEALGTLLASPNEGHVIQLTADLQIAQWRITGAEPLVVESRCTPVGVNAEQTAPLSEATRRTVEVSLSQGRMALVDLCPALTDDEPSPAPEDGTPSIADEAFRTAEWPDNRTFDLLVGSGQSQTAIWTAPESAFEVRVSEWDSIEGAALPTEIWDDTF